MAMEQEHPIYILKIVDRHARHGTLHYPQSQDATKPEIDASRLV